MLFDHSHHHHAGTSNGLPIIARLARVHLILHRTSRSSPVILLACSRSATKEPIPRKDCLTKNGEGTTSPTRTRAQTGCQIIDTLPELSVPGAPLTSAISCRVVESRIGSQPPPIDPPAPTRPSVEFGSLLQLKGMDRGLIDCGRDMPSSCSETPDEP